MGGLGAWGEAGVSGGHQLPRSAALQPPPGSPVPSMAKIFSCSWFWMPCRASKLSTRKTWSLLGLEAMVWSSSTASGSTKALPTCGHRRMAGWREGEDWGGREGRTDGRVFGEGGMDGHE